MAIKIYNTLSGKKEEFKPINGKKVNLYTCGPTVYDSAHIGNLRSYISADILRRTLLYGGYQVNWVMNITDVDDKTIKRTVDEVGPEATPENLRAYTTRYFNMFKTDLEKINIPINQENITFIRVSDKIEEIKTFIKKLINLGYAYKTEDGVYFNIQKYQKKFRDYGSLVGADFLKGRKVGARVKVDDYEKDDLSDFALWKGRDASDGNIFWSDPELGDGRPGWHIECSAINYNAFNGEPTDIHTGGVDLIFPHHTNEIAQSQPIYKPFVNYWVHSEHLLVDNKKMAKRENNFYTLSDLEKETPQAGIALRYLLLQAHYRSPMNFTLENLRGAYAGLKNITPTYGKYEEPVPSSEELIQSVKAALADDLNTARSLAILSKAEGKYVYTLLGIIGLLSDLPFPDRRPLKIEDLPKGIHILIAKREEVRTSKQFIQSDALRKEINDLGYEVEDTPTGPVVWLK